MSEIVLPLLDSSKRTEIFKHCLLNEIDPHLAFADFENQMDIRLELQEKKDSLREAVKDHEQVVCSLEASVWELRRRCKHICQRRTGVCSGVTRCQLCGETFDAD